MLNFKPFKFAIAKKFNEISKYSLFRTAVDKDMLWDTYLASFPKGSDSLYKERTQHNCNACKQFIRTIGNVVAIVDGQLISLWDIAIEETAYQTVADSMATLVKSFPVENVFLHIEPKAGVDKNFQQLLNQVVTWEHFFVNLPSKLVAKEEVVGSKLSEFRSTHDVMLRGLREINADSLSTVLELIDQNSLYRGEEHKAALVKFQQLHTEFITTKDQDLFVWERLERTHLSVSRIRNTSIGTLLIDLSEGMDLEAAVRSFESKVAPTNYRRTSAVVTPRMLENAKKEVEDLGLISALERRYAVLNDISINDVLFADRTAKRGMQGNIFDEIGATLPTKTKNLDKVEEVNIEKFISDILPKVQSIEVLVENRHSSNLVSLIAPVEATAGNLFKWNNKFSWSYNGEVADSIKERVKQAGGNVSGDLCCRLGWYNYDDLDLHMYEPNGDHIYFGEHRANSYSTRNISSSGGLLDVDMNAGSGTTRTPVENIFYQDRQKMQEGKYVLAVHQFWRRETTDVGFTVQLDFLGNVHTFVYDKPVKNREYVAVVQFNYSHSKGIEIITSLPSVQASKEVWGIPTETFHKVQTIMFSPNYWEDAGSIGNKHFFFMLEGCANDGTARGFYNEFLRSELNTHRKALELVGSKLRPAPATEQLSGLGFASTQRNHLVAKVIGAFTRTIKIVF